MNSIVEAKIGDYLRNVMYYDPYECGAILYNMRNLARIAGHDFDDRFAHAGLGAGPEARIAAGITDLALGGGGCETSSYTIRMETERWLRTTPRMSMVA
jgi:hypothetical protein